MKTERVLIYIDGGNIYKSLFKETMNRSKEKIPPIVEKGNIFSFSKFSQYLCSEKRELVGKNIM